MTAQSPSDAPASGAAPAGPTCPSTGRDLRIDALKCLAILLVIATHVLGLRSEFQHVAPGLVTVMVAFNMPMFALLSGWVLAGREGSQAGRFLWRKVLTLYVPYLAWIAIEAPLRQIPLTGIPARLFQALLDPYAGMQMWFLAVLFWMFVIFTLARLVSRSDAWTGAVALAVGAVALVPRITLSVSGLDKIAWLYPFFILGYVLARNRGDRRAIAAVAGVTAAGILAYFAFGDAGLALRYGEALVLTALCAALYGVLPRPVIAAQAWLGRRTLGVYGAQMVVLPFLIVGSGWVGALASWSLVAVAATVVAALLGLFAPLAAVFLGQWPKRTAGDGRLPLGGSATLKESGHR
jgi:surface polysaccharide O-acyltransferase-like enzyme